MMRRFKRRNRTDIKFETPNGICQIIDNMIKETWRINDEEYNYILDEIGKDEEKLELFCLQEEMSFSDIKQAIIMVDDLLDKRYNSQ